MKVKQVKKNYDERVKGYLIDTCLNAQDQYIELIEHYLN